MTIETYKIKTSMGYVIGYNPLTFLTSDEKSEFNEVGYKGKNKKGEEVSRTEYLNSLGKGEFKIEQTKYDNGNFTESFIVIRVLI